MLHAAYLTVEIVLALLIVRDLARRGRPLPHVLMLLATLAIEYSSLPRRIGAGSWIWPRRWDRSAERACA
jgi:hypothetical protein